MLPFRIVNSEEWTPHEQDRQMGIFVENEKILGREYPWGTFKNILFVLYIY